MQTSLLSCISGTPAENWKDEVVQIIKKIVSEGKPVNIATLDAAIIEHNKTDDGSRRILTQKELVNGEFYQLVPDAVWKGIKEGELKLAIP